MALVVLARWLAARSRAFCTMGDASSTITGTVVRPSVRQQASRLKPSMTS